jgi:diguanylate cyclase (GGDEF)-like protein
MHFTGERLRGSSFGHYGICEAMMKKLQRLQDYLNCPIKSELNQLKQECKTLRNLAKIDELTEFFNFRYLKSALESEMERTRRSGLSTGLIMADLDHFKRINDAHGHQNGNLALKWVTRIWKSSIRKIDIPCRYGGEEFVFILPNSSIDDVILTAERLRTGLSSLPIQLDNESVHLTASFGVDDYCGNKNSTADAFIHQVDSLVLKAKDTGRNRICYNSESVAHPSTGVTLEERASLFNR